MTKKRSLLLVSLFLIFGLATSALATQWDQGANLNTQGRGEGQTEATGQVTLAVHIGGIVPVGAYFTMYYNVPIADVATVIMVCTGSAVPGTSPWYLNANCNGDLTSPALSADHHTLTVRFIKQDIFQNNDGSQLAITARVDCTGLTPGSFVTAKTTAHPPNPNVQFSITAGTQGEQDILQVNKEPALSVSFGYWYAKLSQAADVVICLGVIHGNSEYANHFVINVDEEFQWALTSESFENDLDPGSGAGDVTDRKSVV